MNDITDRNIQFVETTWNADWLPMLLDTLRKSGVKNFACAQFSVQFFEAPQPVAISVEPTKTEPRNDDNERLFDAVGG